MNSLSSQIIVNILLQEMALATDQIFLRDQNPLFPNDDRLYIVVGIVNTPRPLSNITYMKQDSGSVYQVCEQQMLETVQIDVLGNTNDVIFRMFEVSAALQSFYSQQQQELNNFQISRIVSNIVDTSGAEGGSILKRYTLRANCMVWYRKTTLLISPLGDYYNDFNTRVDDANTIGTTRPIAQFEIKG